MWSERTVRSRVHHHLHGTPHLEPRWQASLAVLTALILYIVLPAKFIVRPIWLIPALEVALLLVLTVVSPHRHATESRWHRILGIVLIAIVNLANAISLILLIRAILSGHDNNGRELIAASIDIWLTNVLVFALWYWEVDRGGPGHRLANQAHPPDFLFPQMSDPRYAPPHWQPRFIDYLYVAFTNAAAFSPTDTMPLSATAKMLMLVQSLVSLLTVALVAGRAVNILK